MSASFIAISFLFSNLLTARQSSLNMQVRKPSVIKGKTAKALYAKHCSKCHGTSGRGDTVPGQIAGCPDFTDSKWQQQIDDGRMTISVAHGRGGMPAFKEKLSQQQIKSLVAYVRAFAK